LGEFENRVLRRIFRRKREEGAGDWRRLHNEELHDLYASLDINRMIKSRRMSWAEHVARMGELRNAYNILEKLKGRDHFEELGVYGMIILEWILTKWGGMLWAGCMWLRIGTSGGCL